MPQVKVIQPISEQSKKLRVAAYARVSSDSADQLNSFATQVDYYTGYIQSKEEWEFAGLYADEAISGITADKRSDFQRLLADCHAGKIDRILVKSISRFARNTLDCIQTVRELKRLNIPVEFEKENIDTGSMGSEKLKQVSESILHLKQKKKQIEYSTEHSKVMEAKSKEVMALISAEDLNLTEYSDTLVYRIVEKVTVLSSEEIKIRFIGGFEITQPLY